MRWIVLMLVTVLISAIFVRMVGHLLLTLLLAAIVAEMLGGVFSRALRLTGQRRGLAGMLTLVAFALAVIVPLIGVISLAAEQATSMVTDIRGVLAEVTADSASGKFQLPDWVPYHDWLSTQMNDALAKLGDIVRQIAAFLLNSVSALTRGAAEFFLHLFVFIYALAFFVQMNVPPILQVLRLSGLRPETQERLYDRIVTTSHATLKVMFVIGILQGALGGFSFWAAGIESPAFWTVIMIVFAMIPGLGAQGFVFGAAIYFAIEGDMIRAAALAVWATGMAVVIDNMLRPALVRRDSGLHDVLLLVSTLGGLGFFGAPGLVLGPVLAGIFVAIWTDWAEVNARDATAAEE
ncbi:AI-2E family transporter [Chachezhania antarctica]|uniref:AI-2E family transporter n=1 Tax=Chachezhania antarctica TaxID=2340860 RepID=UPI0013CEEEBF|nr:AI-2E family transporter [Chachezhania antarctica]